MAPTYQRPLLPTLAQWPTGAAYKHTEDRSGNAAEIGWRTFFVNPALQQLIDIALKNNRDLRIATLHIEKARAEYQITQADLFPSIAASGTGTHQRVPNNMSVGGQHTISRQYSAGVGFSAYELDFFGRVRSLKDQALALYYASVEAQRSSHIALVAEVANAYLTLLANTASLRLAKDTRISQEASYQLAKHSFKAGVTSALDFSRAQTTVETARADEALYLSRVAQAQNALAVLLGSAIPDDLPLDTDLNHVHLLAELPVGLPSDLLQQRPDILAAEQKLKAANANIGAARAAFFPSIVLTANAGAASTALSQLFKAGSGAWSFIPQITLPLFTAGKNKANLDSAHIAKDITVAEYEKTIQVAFKEVADTLAQRSTLMDQLAARQALSKATAKAYHLAKLRYEHGVDTYLSLLDTQRSLYSAQQQLISTKLSQLNNLVNFYKALGGGWSANTVGQPAPTSALKAELQ
jgi:multidrug efflux system outer membrane protein